MSGVGVLGATAVKPLTQNGIPIDPNLRILAGATLVNTMGNGAITTTFALYFTRIVHIPATQVGLALSAAAVVALFVQVPIGHLGDVRGPRELLRWLTLATGIVTLGLLFTHNIWALGGVLMLEAFFDRGAGAVRNGVIARIAEGGQGVRFKAYLRAVTNVGISVGGALGGLALTIDKPWAYLSVFAFNSLTCIINSFAVARLPHLEKAPLRAAGEPRLQVLRDIPFVVMTVLTGIFAMHFVIIEVAMPLWIAHSTQAPKSLVAVTLMINTVMVAIFQVRLSRGADTVMAASKALRTGGLWIGAGFGLVALAAGQSKWVAVALLCGGALVHVVGEMVGSGGQWGVQMGLAPRERQGQYQGFSGMGFSLSNVLAPSLSVALCINGGAIGWAVLAAVIIAAGALSVPVSAWALRTRERYGVLTHTG